MRTVFAALVLVFCAGCAAFASKSDYADYRAVRMAGSDEERLLAMRRYVASHPDGQWHAEVQAERKARDMGVFESGKSHRPGLELYLAAFPDGAFATQARSRLGAIEMIERRKREEAERAELLRQQRRAREAELSRTWVSRFAAFWMETLLSIDGWGTPIADVASANADFSRAFGRAPRPRCTREECVKYYDSRYGVPVPGGTRVERQMRLLLRLTLAEGRLVRAELLLPGWGFSRWHEVEERSLVVDADPEQRAAAVQWALGRLQPLLAGEGRAPAPLPGFELPQISAPAIAASGELADTTAADPSAPANTIQGVPGGAAEASMSDLLAPVEPEAAPDMVMDPLRVDEHGSQSVPNRAVAAPESPQVPTPGGGSDEMVMQPLQVTRDGQGAEVSATEQEAPAASAPPEQTFVPRRVEAFTVGTLRVAFVAAGTEEGAPAYDGVVIEPVVPGKAKGKGDRSRHGERPASSSKPPAGKPHGAPNSP